MEEYGQALLALLVMAAGIALVYDLLISEGMLNQIMMVYMRSICG